MGATLSSSSPSYSSRSKYNGDDDDRNAEFLWRIFQWDPTWLDDEKYEKEAPPIFEEDEAMVPTSLFYENYEDYSRSMEPLMLLEFFQNLKKTNDDIPLKKQIKTKSVIGKIDGYHTRSVCNSIDRKKIHFNLSAEVTKAADGNYPTRGDLVRIKYNETSEIFGYVYEFSKSQQSYSTTSGARCCNDPKCIGCMVKLGYKVFAKSVDIKEPFRKNVKMSTVVLMSQYLRLFRALGDLPNSPLFDLVLKPHSDGFTMSQANISTIQPLVTEHTLNPTQLEIVAGVVKTVDLQETRICLIQGPPGTGKSTVIINIICQILKNPIAKILLCTPSNKAVDEILLRLLDIQKNLEEKEIFLNIVRIGREEAMDPDVKSVSFSTLSMCSQMDSMSMSKSRGGGAMQHQKEVEILQDANIIASTLSSCYSQKMETVYGRQGNNEFSVCIVDEAGQSTELGTLIPLMLNVKTLVLVGDPKQLPPTILSQNAKKHGMDISLFSRAQKNFENDPWNPIVMLNVQYRMVEPIVRWPGNYFYDNKLKNGARVSQLPLCNYKVINHPSHQTVSKHANEGEARMVSNLLIGIINEFISRKEKIPSIGVITPYQHQRQVITYLMKEICSSLKSEILNKSTYRPQQNRRSSGIKLSNYLPQAPENEEKKTDPLYEALQNIRINTVDSFQGQERDIIIMSCVRSNGIGFVSNPNRLNVSLTRARHTIIIIGNFATFRKNLMWKSLITDAESRGDYIDVNDVYSKPEFLKNLVLK